MKTPVVLLGIDWSELRNQKATLLGVIKEIEIARTEGRTLGDADGSINDLTGILHLIDSLQDYAVDVMGISSIHVYDFELEDKCENDETESLHERMTRQTAYNFYTTISESETFLVHDKMSAEFIELIRSDKNHEDAIRLLFEEEIRKGIAIAEYNPNQFDDTIFDIEDFFTIALNYIFDIWESKQCGDLKETLHQKYARETSERMYWMLNESEFFHTHDEMPAEYVETIMADETHRKNIVAIFQTAIEERIADHKYESNVIPDSYDFFEIEEFDSIATTYIFDIWESQQTKKVFTCNNCGSDNVQIKTWKGLNNGEMHEVKDVIWCEDCEGYVEVSELEVPRNAKLIGFRVFGCKECTEGDKVFSVSQCRKMKNYKTNNLIAIWSDELVEPKIMFEGNPRD